MITVNTIRLRDRKCINTEELSTSEALTRILEAVAAMPVRRDLFEAHVYGPQFIHIPPGVGGAGTRRYDFIAETTKIGARLNKLVRYLIFDIRSATPQNMQFLPVDMIAASVELLRRNQQRAAMLLAIDDLVDHMTPDEQNYFFDVVDDQTLSALMSMGIDGIRGDELLALVEL